MRRVLVVLFLLAAVLGSGAESAPASAAAAVPSWTQCVDHFSGDWGTLSHTCGSYPMPRRAGQTVYGHWTRTVWPSGYTRITITYPTFTRPVPAPVVIVPACYRFAPSVDAAIAGASRQTGVPISIIAAVIQTESHGQNVGDYADSYGSIGLMQLLPSTAAWITGMPFATFAEQTEVKSLLWDEEWNILAGARYLRYWFGYWGGSWPAAIGSYNGGYTPNGYYRQAVYANMCG